MSERDVDHVVLLPMLPKLCTQLPVMLILHYTTARYSRDSLMGRQTGSHILLLSTAILSLFALIACDTGFLGSGTDQAITQQDAAAHSGASANGADDLADLTPQRPVVAETLPYAEVDDKLVYGHFVFPADMVDPLPGVIVIHEWWGLNDGVRAMSDRLAAEGYVVLAVDLFDGESTRSPADARAMMVKVVENPERAEDNLRQAYQFLVDSGQAPRIGALGWDFGGGWALTTAMLFPDELDAAVIYYGQVIADEARLEPLDVPILALFGDDDRGIPMSTITNFEKAMENLGKNFEIEIYPGAKHAFADPGSSNYDAEIAEQAWARALAFLRFHLAVSVK